MFVGPGRLELPQIRLKVGCIAFLPRARGAAGGAAFELLRHRLSFGGSARNRTETVRKARVGYSHARSHAGLRSLGPKTKEAAEVSQGGSRSVSASMPSSRVWSLPFVGRGARLALDTLDGPVAKIGRAVPIEPRAHVSHDALAPYDSRGCGCGRHERVSTNRRLARSCTGCQQTHELRATEDSRSHPARATVLRSVAYKVQLIYFRPKGKFLTTAEITIARDEIVEIWKEIDQLRRLGSLPGLRPGAGRDLLIVVDVPDHPQRVLHMVMPPFMDDDDVTPVRIPTGEMQPLVRVPLDEIPRTSTRDIVKIDLDADPEANTVVADDEVTPVDRPFPFPKPPEDEEPR